MGTRFLPATKSMPKEMLPIVDKPVLQYVVEEAAASGIEDILIVTGRGKTAIENHFDDNPELEAFLPPTAGTPDRDRARHRRRLPHPLHPPEAPARPGRRVRLARWHVGSEPFAVLLGDTIIVPPSGERPACVSSWMPTSDGSSVVAVQPVRRTGAALRRRRGAPLPDNPRLRRLTRLVEKPLPEPLRAAWSSPGATCSRARSSTRSTPPPRSRGRDPAHRRHEPAGRSPGVPRARVAGPALRHREPAGYIRCFVDLALARDDIGAEVRPACATPWPRSRGVVSSRAACPAPLGGERLRSAQAGERAPQLRGREGLGQHAGDADLGRCIWVAASANPLTSRIGSSGRRRRTCRASSMPETSGMRAPAIRRSICPPSASRQARAARASATASTLKPSCASCRRMRHGCPGCPRPEARARSWAARLPPKPRPER